MHGKRRDRISALVQERLAYVLTSRARDPRIGFATITHVEVSDDMKFARVFYSVMGAPDQKEKTREGLEQARGFFQRDLAESLTLRSTPHLTFILDESLEVGLGIDKIIREIHDDRG